MIKLYALMENTPFQPDFRTEHGLSLYIETKRHKILFDTGQSGQFADNAADLGIDLETVDMAVLSHGHYDHGGGIRRFLERNTHAKVYVSEYAFGKYYHGQRYIGLDPALRDSDRLISVPSVLKIDDELTLDPCRGRDMVYPVDDAGLSEMRRGNLIPDAFLHEQYLIIQEAGRRIVISGCSHRGVLNIMDWLRPDVLVGGFHFMNQVISEGENPVLDSAAEILSNYDTLYYTCHCTGKGQYEYMKKKMGDRLRYLASGQRVTI